MSMMFSKQVVPAGEEGEHMPFEVCACNPFIRKHQGQLILWHRAFDHRESWLSIEIMLGMTCHEHLMHVDRATYERGAPHNHIPRPMPMFEYGHDKIDPR